MIEITPLGDNLRRLLGLHALPATHLSRLIRVSPQSLSVLMSGKRNASLSTVRVLAQFFEIPVERLLETPFRDLLITELADTDRFDRVEAKIPDEARSRQWHLG